MSRCFPFPPPGYEKKIRTDEADSLIKEKQKEKKHKKDIEKKERKEKKDKEKSKEKPKERKEKHKDRKNKDRNKEKSRTSEGKTAAGVLSNTGDREKLVINTSQSNGNGESKFVHDMARMIRDEEATESQSARKINLPSGVTEKNIPCPVPQTNHRKDFEKKINTHRNFAMAKRSENAVLQVSSCMDQKGTEVMVKPVEKKELQEKNHLKENAIKSDNLLDKEGIKKSEPTYRSSKEKKEEKTEVISKTGQEKLRFVEGGPRLKERETDSVDIRKVRGQDLSKVGVNFSSEGILGKRKDLETNGFLYENGTRLNKMQKPVASPISSMENGRKLGVSQTPPKPTSELQGVMHKPEIKEHIVNGFIDSQEPKNRPSVSSAKMKDNGEASSKKRPHSDLKYLDQILNVPKREALHEVEEEPEWLFGQPGVKLLKKQRTDSTTKTLQVWDQALKIESADIIALPYVVPL